MYKRNGYQLFFTVVCILALLCGNELIQKYNNNIEISKDTSVVATQERKIWSLYSIVFTENKMDKGISVANNTNKSEIPYGYFNDDNIVVFGVADAEMTKIDVLQERQEPYVDIITYRNVVKIINHNNGIETFVTEYESNEFVFYLPKEMMQYKQGLDSNDSKSLLEISTNCGDLPLFIKDR